ncbi:MAG TPA: FAD-binding oxidoreductase [Polyangiaceae bacterium]|nr:FAD-binding oxidoreductase [Polyangiaceae bacterium]
MAVDCERAPTPADAIAGVAARRVFEPTSAQDCADVFQAARAGGMALAPIGGGTELGLGAPPARLDAVVSTRRLDRIVDYAPSDQIVVVEAGARLSTVQRALQARSQRLASDPPLPDRATIGGLLSTNNFGPLRTRYGSLRDLLIGVSFVRADGRVARGGGRVVKNVAGFDMPRLMVGALGTLGMIVTATFRLHPSPERETTLRVSGAPARVVRAVVAQMRQDQIEPAAVAALGAGGAFDVLLRFEGFPAAVLAQRDRAAALLGRLESRFDELSPEQARDAWREHDAARTRGGARVKISAPAATIEAVASEVLPGLVGTLAGAAVVAYPTIGTWFVAGEVNDAAAFAGSVPSARSRAARVGGSLVVHELPAGLRGAVDVWGPPPPAFGLMRRVKERFDPERRLNPGRFVGGL